MNPDKFEKILLQNNKKLTDDIRQYISATLRQISKVAAKSKTTKKISKSLEKKIDKLLEGLHDKLTSHIRSEIATSWNIADNKNDALIESYIKGIEISETVKEGLFVRNNEALTQFLKRKKNGLNLSDRVWNITNDLQQQVTFYLESGIATGRSAKDIAKDLVKYLNNPKAIYKVRDENGNLVHSEKYKQYRPGSGTYKNPFKNAFRLARTEINMAYRYSDYERMQNIDFIVGYTVHLSNAHPQSDICDQMVGEYPKTFKFGGWHPNCFCFVTTKLLPKSEFKQFLKTGKANPEYYVRDIPGKARTYIDRNTKSMKKWKSLPYWIQDNFEYNQRDGYKLIQQSENSHH